VYHSETGNQLTLTIRDEQVSIPKSEISETRYAPSAMPAMGGRLNRTQLRDLVEFLSQLNDQS
jgi:mono/diheme cytochrome c family protein